MQALRTYILLLPILLLITTVGLLMQIICFLTFDKGREFCRRYLLKPLCRLIFFLFGIRMESKGLENVPNEQVIYIGNHSSTIDMPAICAMSLPRTRYFLSKCTYKLLPITLVASCLGTFYLDTQDQPEKRRDSFKRALTALKATGDSVFLTPEGMRVTTGEIGPFNRGAFHLAAELKVPIVPIFIYIPKEIDPGMGINAGSGDIAMHFLPPIDTNDWQVDRVNEYKDKVRQLYVDYHQNLHRSKLVQV